MKYDIAGTLARLGHMRIGCYFLDLIFIPASSGISANPSTSPEYKNLPLGFSYGVIYNLHPWLIQYIFHEEQKCP